MRKGEGCADLPAKPSETFLAYLHRLAQYQGYIGADVAPPQDRRRAKRGGPGFLERLDSIFGVRREPGE